MISKRGSDPNKFPISLGAKGRIVLPAVLRRQLGLREGDRLIASTEPDGSLRLVRAEDAIRRLQGIFKDVEPGVSWADELIAERRAEALAEGQE